MPRSSGCLKAGGGLSGPEAGGDLGLEEAGQGTPPRDCGSLRWGLEQGPCGRGPLGVCPWVSSKSKATRGVSGAVESQDLAQGLHP